MLNRLILDVRSTDERKGKSVKNSMHIATPLPPLDSLALQKLQYKLRMATEDLPRNHRIYVYCKKGHRSRVAYEYLRFLGFYNAVNLGGIEEPLLASLFNSTM